MAPRSTPLQTADGDRRSRPADPGLRDPSRWRPTRVHGSADRRSRHGRRHWQRSLPRTTLVWSSHHPSRAHRPAVDTSFRLGRAGSAALPSRLPYRLPADAFAAGGTIWDLLLLERRKRRPARFCLVNSVVRCSGSAAVSRWATASANRWTSSKVGPTVIGATTCRPREPVVLTNGTSFISSSIAFSLRAVLRTSPKSSSAGSRSNITWSGWLGAWMHESQTCTVTTLYWAR